ncbi:abortive infection family protein [Lysinibacillus sp. NPDC093712]|uniref:abortive infection family protein n=1 Tax=Lysinibacillus sp. NPDC093712 TaxID=3390579 RepID=UPI003D009305
MNSLKSTDRILFEKLFGMETGYVLNFNDRSFRGFVVESTGIDIFDGEYTVSMSKAKRLRLFLEKENDYIVQKLLKDLIAYWYNLNEVYDHKISEEDLRLYDRCLIIISTLIDRSNVIEDIDTFSSIDVVNTKAINLLTNEIKDKLKENNPELALDRLHTFSVKFFRELCKKHDLSFEKDDALHTLMALYRKHIEVNYNIQSEMTVQILKTNTNILNNFNNVRNDKSYAHDNVILNKSESKLICNHVISLLKFIDEIEESGTVNTIF